MYTTFIVLLYFNFAGFGKNIIANLVVECPQLGIPLIDN
jgi:hypothetical protein